jgi:hypothetical protein
LGWTGVQLGHTRGFGWSERQSIGLGARIAGRAWTVAGIALIFAGIVVWMAKA